jgi:SAM-dependent methyltransferase
MPVLLDQYNGIFETVAMLQPSLAKAVRAADGVWPRRLGLAELFPTDFNEAISNPLFLCLLESVPVRIVAVERLLTTLREILLEDIVAGREFNGDQLVFACTLAKQCFVNEYVFATSAKEDKLVDQIIAALEGDVSPMQIAAIAMYKPLHTLPAATALLSHAWPEPVADVLTQQLREPAQEAELRASIPCLTAIEDDTSKRVRQQYEENPYPRWVRPAGLGPAVTLDEYLRRMFPVVPFTSLGKTEDLDILVAGCGTGWHSIALAGRIAGAKLLAVDLSLASLSFAKRRTPAYFADRIEYAQADILALGGLERRFDVVDASGVLHHMADPQEGLRVLLSLLRPNGFLHCGLYSRFGRHDINAARAFVAERYKPTVADIRRCRQNLMGTPMSAIANVADFYSTSECRDLLFHVQESQTTVPQIKEMIAEHGLRFLGFEFKPEVRERLHEIFARSGWSLTDLDRWNTIESAEPDLFAGMYQFWVQKPN